jgi:hypothetical protein
METGHYYFDEIVELFSFEARMPVSTTISQSGFQERARACVVVTTVSDILLTYLAVTIFSYDDKGINFVV